MFTGLLTLEPSLKLGQFPQTSNLLWLTCQIQTGELNAALLSYTSGIAPRPVRGLLHCALWSSLTFSRLVYSQCRARAADWNNAAAA